MSAFKRSQWNALIDDINVVRANPPEDTDCQPLPPLEHVGLNHRWSKSDIRGAQNAIIETCSSIEFDEIKPRWEQETIDDLRDALAFAWCDCEDEDCDPHEGDGAQFIIRTLIPRVVSPCFGDDPDAKTPLCELIHDMNVGPPGIIGRSWGVRREFSDGGSAFVAGGVINCQGNVVCEGNEMIDDHWGVAVSCGDDCESESCQEMLANAEATVATMPYIDYVLTVQTFFAVCEECE